MRIRRDRVTVLMPFQHSQLVLAATAGREQAVAVEELLEALAELGRHQVVQDRIDGGVQVEHDPAKIKQIVIRLHAQTLQIFIRSDDDPQREHAKRQ